MSTAPEDAVQLENNQNQETETAGNVPRPFPASSYFRGNSNRLSVEYFQSHGLNEQTSMRLYNSVRPPAGLGQRSNTESIDTIQSCDENGHSCRICRYFRTDMPLIPSPCLCSGSVGFVHLKCLQRWIRFKSDNHCEICHQEYSIAPEKRNYSQLVRSFFRAKYLGSIVKTLLSLISVTPLAYFTLSQLITTIDSLEIDKSSLKLLVVGPAMLLATSKLTHTVRQCYIMAALGIYFFIYFDWAVTGIFRIKYTFEHWWKFGDSIDDEDASDVLGDLETLSSIFDADWIG